MTINIEKIEVNGVEINKKRADNLIRRLVNKEAINVRTKRLTDMQMIKEIQKWIKEEAECY